MLYAEAESDDGAGGQSRSLLQIRSQNPIHNRLIVLWQEAHRQLRRQLRLRARATPCCWHDTHTHIALMHTHSRRAGGGDDNPNAPPPGGAGGGGAPNAPNDPNAPNAPNDPNAPSGPNGPSGPNAPSGPNGPGGPNEPGGPNGTDIPIIPIPLPQWPSDPDNPDAAGGPNGPNGPNPDGLNSAPEGYKNCPPLFVTFTEYPNPDFYPRRKHSSKGTRARQPRRQGQIPKRGVLYAYIQIQHQPTRSRVFRRSPTPIAICPFFPRLYLHR